MQRWLMAALFLIGIGLGLAGCGGSDKIASPSNPSTSPKGKPGGGQLTSPGRGNKLPELR